MIILAGVTLNALFAFLVFTGLAFKNGRQFDPNHDDRACFRRATPGGREGRRAALPVGTRITAIDGEPVQSWDDVVERLTAGNQNEITLDFADHASITVALHRDALAERGALALAIEPLHPAVIGELSPNYPAIAAGLEVGEFHRGDRWDAGHQWAEAVEKIRGASGRELRFDVVRAGRRRPS